MSIKRCVRWSVVWCLIEEISRQADREGCGADFVKLALAFIIRFYMIVTLCIYGTVLSTSESHMLH